MIIIFPLSYVHLLLLLIPYLFYLFHIHNLLFLSIYFPLFFITIIYFLVRRLMTVCMPSFHLPLLLDFVHNTLIYSLFLQFFLNIFLLSAIFIFLAILIIYFHSLLRLFFINLLIVLLFSYFDSMFVYFFHLVEPLLARVPNFFL